MWWKSGSVLLLLPSLMCGRTPIPPYPRRRNVRVQIWMMCWWVKTNTKDTKPALVSPCLSGGGRWEILSAGTGWLGALVRPGVVWCLPPAANLSAIVSQLNQTECLTCCHIQQSWQNTSSSTDTCAVKNVLRDTNFNHTNALLLWVHTHIYTFYQHGTMQPCIYLYWCTRTT